jgi:hypothetical protein
VNYVTSPYLCQWGRTGKNPANHSLQQEPLRCALNISPMKTKSQSPRATFVTASLLLAAPALAAGHIDPKVVGHWHGSLSAQQNGPAQVDLTLKPAGAETITITSPTDKLAAKATYTAKAGTLTMTYVSGTENGRPAKHHQKKTLKYKASGDTLTLYEDGSTSPLVLHRVKG